MSDAGSDERFQVQRPDVVEQLIGGELVVINFANGHYHGIRGGGVRIWQMLDAGFSVREIALGFAPSAADEVLTAVSRFVGRLEAQQLVARDSSRSALPEPQSWPSVGYTSPELESRQDMQDFLTLDPIHDVDANGWPRAKDGSGPVET